MALCACVCACMCAAVALLPGVGLAERACTAACALVWAQPVVRSNVLAHKCSPEVGYRRTAVRWCRRMQAAAGAGLLIPSPVCRDCAARGGHTVSASCTACCESKTSFISCTVMHLPVYWHVHVWQRWVTIKRLEKCPCKNGRAPQYAAKGVVLQVGIIQLAANDLEARAPPRRQVLICALCSLKRDRLRRPMAQEVSRQRCCGAVERAILNAAKF